MYLPPALSNTIHMRHKSPRTIIPALSPYKGKFGPDGFPWISVDSMEFHGFTTHAIHAFAKLFPCNCFPHASMEKHGKYPMLSMVFCSDGFPWISRISMEFSPCFLHGIPWFLHAFSTREGLFSISPCTPLIGHHGFLQI